MNKEIKLIKIRNYLSDLEKTIEFDTRAGLFNLNKMCEDLYCPLLNIMYDYNLSNANITLEKNYPAVDLVDFKNSISIQVTSDNSGKKIKSTIESFIRNRQYENFQKVKVLVITSKQKKYASFDTKGLFRFNSKSDIIDNKDLYSIITTLENEKINKIFEFLQKELDKDYKFVNLNSIKKPKEIVTNLFSARKICKTSDYRISRYFSEYNSYKPLDVLKDNNCIIILSDAGLGKSELCKDLVNKINQKANYFSFYFKLINYAGENIEDLKPKEYEKLSNDAITFILDGYDEIINSHKNIFIKKIQQFININKQAKVIITSRTNFYNCENENFSGTIANFSSYYLLPLNEDNLRDLATSIYINYKEFLTEAHKKNLINLIYNPFYTIDLMTKFKSDKKLLAREEFIPYIIDKTFCIDIEKYNSTKDLETVKLKIFQILQLLSITIAMLDTNSISIKELEKLIDNEEDRKLLNYSGIWKKENNNFYFLHNNFWEYLASEKLRELTIEQIKKVVTYDSNSFNPNWLNILTFYLEKNNDSNFINWLLEIYPEFIFYLEKDKISEDNRIELFKKTFEYYENKKIWLPNSIYYNDTFANFIFSDETIKFLIAKLDKHNHYTIIFNALNLLFQFGSFGRYTSEIKDTMIKISYDNHYNTSQKRDAINILAKHKMLNDNELNKIIESNTSIEDAYLRAAYYFYLNENDINTSNISILLNRLEKTQNYYHTNFDKDDEEVNLADEHMEFNKVFSNIKDTTVFQIIIETIDNLHRKECKEILNEEIIKNLCVSFEYLYRNKSANLDLLLKLYLILEENYLRREIEIIPQFLEKLDLKLEFFKKYMMVDEKKRFYDGNIIDEKCLKYFYDKYKEYSFSDDLARSIIYSTSIQNNDYINLNLLYLERTGHDIIAERKKHSMRKVKRGKRTQDYFNAIFNKENFILEIKEYLQHINLNYSGIINKEQIKSIEEDFYDDNDKYNYIIDFLRSFKRKENIILLSDIENLDWDYFIVCESYNILRDEKDITVSQDQRDIIEEICKKYLQKFSFRSAIKYKSYNSTSTSYLAIFTWYFRYKFNFNYPESILLDMLSFDWVTEEHQSVGIEYIENAIEYNKVKNRIIDNIKTQDMGGDVLKNHINYCIKNKLQNLSKYLAKYLLNKKLQFFEKDLIIDYIIMDKGIDYIISNFLSKTDFDTELRIVDKIFKINSNVIIPFIGRRFKYLKKQERKIIYLKYLIRANNKYGIDRYYEMIKRRMCCVDINNCYENSIKDALANISDISLIEPLSNIYILTHDPNFKDNRFEGIYSGCKQAFINMAFSNLQNNSYEITLNKLNSIINNNPNIKNIGFTHYIIDDIKERYLREKRQEKNISEIINEINMLFPKSKGLIY